VTSGAALTEQMLTGPPSSLLNIRFESRRYTFGAAVEFALTDHIAVQFNPLYKRLGYTQMFGPMPLPALPAGVLAGTGTLISTRSRSTAWEFPVVAKYYLGNRNSGWRTFVGTGYAWETGWQRSDVEQSLVDLVTGATLGMFPPSTSEARSLTGVGIIFNGGAVLRKGRLGMAPELRYTRWGNSALTGRDKNHVDFLLTLRF